MHDNLRRIGWGRRSLPHRLLYLAFVIQVHAQNITAVWHDIPNSEIQTCTELCGSSEVCHNGTIISTYPMLFTAVVPLTASRYLNTSFPAAQAQAVRTSDSPATEARDLREKRCNPPPSSINRYNYTHIEWLYTSWSATRTTTTVYLPPGSTLGPCTQEVIGEEDMRVITGTPKVLTKYTATTATETTTVVQTIITITTIYDDEGGNERVQQELTSKSPISKLSVTGPLDRRQPSSLESFNVWNPETESFYICECVTVWTKKGIHSEMSLVFHNVATVLDTRIETKTVMSGIVSTVFAKRPAPGKAFASPVPLKVSIPKETGNLHLPQTKSGIVASVEAPIVEIFSSKIAPVSIFIAPDGRGVVLPGKHTLPLGSQTTVSGHVISLPSVSTGPLPTAVFIDDVPFPLAQPSSLKFSPITFTTASSGGGIILPGGQTLRPGSKTSLSGHEISIPSSSTALHAPVVIIDNRPFPLVQPSSPRNPPVSFTTASSGGDIILPDGQTLRPGSKTTISGHEIFIPSVTAAAPSPVVFIDNIPFSMAQPSQSSHFSEPINASQVTITLQPTPLSLASLEQHLGSEVPMVLLPSGERLKAGSTTSWNGHVITLGDSGTVTVDGSPIHDAFPLVKDDNTILGAAVRLSTGEVIMLTSENNELAEVPQKAMQSAASRFFVDGRSSQEVTITELFVTEATVMPMRTMEHVARPSGSLTAEADSPSGSSNEVPQQTELSNSGAGSFGLGGESVNVFRQWVLILWASFFLIYSW